MRSLATAYKTLSGRGLIPPQESLESFTVKMRDPSYLEKAAASLAQEKGMDPGIIAQDYRERTEAWFDPANDNEFTRKFPQYRGLSPSDSYNVAEKFKASTLGKLSQVYKGDFNAFVENVRAGRKPVGGLTPNQAAMYQMVQRIVGAGGGLNVPGIQSVNDWGAYLQDPEMSQKNPYSPVVNNTIARNWDMDTPAQGSIRASVFPSATYRGQDPNVGAFGTAIGALEDVVSAVPRAIGSALDATGVSKGTMSGGTPTEIASPGQQFLNYSVTGSVPGGLASKTLSGTRASRFINPVEKLSDVVSDVYGGNIPLRETLKKGAAKGALYEALPTAYLATQSDERVGSPLAEAAVSAGLGTTIGALASAAKPRLAEMSFNKRPLSNLGKYDFYDRIKAARGASPVQDVGRYTPIKDEFGNPVPPTTGFPEERLTALDRAYEELLGLEQGKRSQGLKNLQIVPEKDATEFMRGYSPTDESGTMFIKDNDPNVVLESVPFPQRFKRVDDNGIRTVIPEWDPQYKSTPGLPTAGRASTEVRNAALDKIRDIKSQLAPLADEMNPMGVNSIYSRNERGAIKELVTQLTAAENSNSPLEALMSIRTNLGAIVAQNKANQNVLKPLFGRVSGSVDDILEDISTGDELYRQRAGYNADPETIKSLATMRALREYKNKLPPTPEQPKASPRETYMLAPKKEIEPQQAPPFMEPEIPVRAARVKKAYTQPQRDAAAQVASSYPNFERLFESRSQVLPSKMIGEMGDASSDLYDEGLRESVGRVLPENLTNQMQYASKQRTNKMLTDRERAGYNPVPFKTEQSRQRGLNDLIDTYLPSAKAKNDFIDRHGLPRAQGKKTEVDYLTPEIIQAALAKIDNQRSLSVPGKEGTSITLDIGILKSLAQMVAGGTGFVAREGVKALPRTVTKANPLTLGSMVNMKGEPVEEWELPQE